MSIGSWPGFQPRYREGEVKKYSPSSAGVYALWVKYVSGKWKCFYVGKTENLEARFLDHLGDEEPNVGIKENVAKYTCAFSWNEITTESERAGAEKYLYNELKPECNQNDPGGSPLEIPLPPIPSSAA